MVEDTLFQIALIGFSTGFVIAGWFGFIGSAVKYILQLSKFMGS